MPRRAARANGAPYTKVLSALLKPDLVRLCGEFRLAADGSVVNLRKRLKDHLNLNRDRIYRDDWYKALYPKHRRVGEPAAREQSPARSDRSFDSWHGIGNQPQDVPQVVATPSRSPTPPASSDPGSDDGSTIPRGSPFPLPGDRKPFPFFLKPTFECLSVMSPPSLLSTHDDALSLRPFILFILSLRHMDSPCSLEPSISLISEIYGFSVFF